MQITVKQLKQLIREAVEEVWSEGEKDQETVDECGYEMADAQDGGPLRRHKDMHHDEDMEEEERFLEEYLAEAKKKPSSGLTKKEKSEVVKKAKAGKDIGKKGKGFEDLAKKAAKQYGSKEKGEKVAAAAMWKNIKK